MWRHIPTSAKTKAEAKVLQREVAQKIDRQRLGLDPIPGSDMTVGELLYWWLDTYSKGTPSHRRNESAVKRHLLAADLAKMQLHLLSKGDVETLLQSKKQELSPKSLNNLRGFLHSAFSAAEEAGKYSGPNPVAKVKRRKVPERAPRSWRHGRQTAYCSFTRSGTSGGACSQPLSSRGFARASCSGCARAMSTWSRAPSRSAAATTRTRRRRARGPGSDRRRAAALPGRGDALRARRVRLP